MCKQWAVVCNVLNLVFGYTIQEKPSDWLLSGIPPFRCLHRDSNIITRVQLHYYNQIWTSVAAQLPEHPVIVNVNTAFICSKQNFQIR